MSEVYSLQPIGGNQLDAPGSAAYPQGTTVYGSTSPAADDPTRQPMAVHRAAALELPSRHDSGSAPRQGNALGWSAGLGAIMRLMPFTGRTLAVVPLGVHPHEGHVGFMTRSTARRRNALTADLTPTDEIAAQLIAPYTG